MLFSKVVETVAPRSSYLEATGLSLTHSSVFLRTCPSMGSSTRDDDGAGERRREQLGSVCRRFEPRSLHGARTAPSGG